MRPNKNKRSINIKTTNIPTLYNNTNQTQAKQHTNLLTHVKTTTNSRMNNKSQTQAKRQQTLHPYQNNNKQRNEQKHNSANGKTLIT